MKKVFLFITLGLIFSLNIHGQNFVKVDKSYAGQSIQISQDQVLEISLPRMAGTGYIWCEPVSTEKTAPQQSISKIGDGDFIHNDTSGKLKGGGGTQILRYIGASQGTTVLNLELRRPWEKDKPAIDNYTITILSSGKYTGTYTPPVKKNPEKVTSTLKSSSSVPSKWDWRSKCTPICDQQNCGDCYAFAACGTFECVIKIIDDSTRSISEEWLTNCDSVYPNGCKNGGNDPLDMFLSPKGAVYSSEDPWTTSEGNGHTGACGGPYTYHEHIISHAYANGGTDDNAVATTAEVKTAIYNYGPIFSYVDASSDAFSNYSGNDIFTEASPTGETDHCIVLVGWCDSSTVSNGGYWILRNSWNTSWGINGYMYISYGSDLVEQGANYINYKGVISHPAGINEITEPKFEVYPNPTNGEFTIALDNTSFDTYKMTILNSLGQEILTESITNSNYKKIFNFKDLSKGIYYIRLLGKDNVFTKKMIIY